MRKQRPRGTTTRDAVLNAALAVVDRSGVDRLTIRSVARQVGAPPMSLYSHFANKEALLDLMYGEIVRRLYPDHGHATWQDELLALCQHLRVLLLQHWMPLLARPTTPANVPVRERILSLMAADGIAPDVAFTAMSGAALSATGLALAELALRNPHGSSDIEKRYERIREWARAAEDAPATRAGTTSPKFDLERVLLLTLRAMIRGLELAPRTLLAL
jgi:AcrR family transcriptional regulator